MRAFPWILAAIGIGTAAYIIMNEPAPQHAGGYDGVEDAARGTSEWGSKSRVIVAGADVLGKLKEGVGNVTGNQELASEGVVDQAAGKVKKAAGKVAQAAGKTLHDLNQ